MSNAQMDIAQFNKNIEEYGFEAAVSWASQFPNTIHKDLGGAFDWSSSREWRPYWNDINNSRKPLGGKTTTSNPPPPTPTQTASKVLPFEEEIQKRLDARKAVNAKNKAIHEKAIELAEASRKKLEKKLKKLIADEGVVVIVDDCCDDDDEDEDAPF